MNQIVKRALCHWGMEGAQYKLVAARENSVFRVDCRTGSVALRLHRQGYRTNAELRSELQWMKAVSEGGIVVPTPIPTPQGEVLLQVDDVQVDILTWLSGSTLDSAMNALDSLERSDLLRNLGIEMARLHNICDEWLPPTGFERVAWDLEGLLGETPLWGRFWENSSLSSEEKLLFKAFRSKAIVELKRRQNDLDFGLIHADLVPANVLVSTQTIKLIDFDDGGFGFRLFEIATALLKHMNDDDYSSLRDALIEGYTSIRGIELSTLDLFLAIRAATYVGWNISRMDETGAKDRNSRFIETTKGLARKYLER